MAKELLKIAAVPVSEVSSPREARERVEAAFKGEGLVVKAARLEETENGDRYSFILKEATPGSPEPPKPPMDLEEALDEEEGPELPEDDDDEEPEDPKMKAMDAIDALKAALDEFFSDKTEPPLPMGDEGPKLSPKKPKPPMMAHAEIPKEVVAHLTLAELEAEAKKLEKTRDFKGYRFASVNPRGDKIVATFRRSSPFIDSSDPNYKDPAGGVPVEAVAGMLIKANPQTREEAIALIKKHWPDANEYARERSVGYLEGTPDTHLYNQKRR